MVSLFGWPTVARAVVGPLLGAALVVGLISGCGASLATTGGTDPAAGAFAGLGGPASAGLPGSLPGSGDRFGSGFGAGTGAGSGAGTGTGASAQTAPARVPSPAPVPAPAVPDVPRRSASLAGQPAPVSAPVRVSAASLGIDMPIEAVGLTDSAAMALPENPAVAAWYRYGAGPGSPAGATVIAAHVDSLVYDIGPFAQLADAPVGTEIVVETADGVAHRYAVASVDSQQKPEVPWASVFDRSGQPRLTLVTCGGEFDYEARRYLSNVFVTAVPVP